MSKRGFRIGIAGLICLAAIVGACRRATHNTNSEEETMNTTTRPETMEFPAIPDPVVEHLVFYCGDPRCPLAFEGLPQKLGIPPGRYTKVCTFGGSAPLAYPKQRPHDYAFLESQIRLATKHFTALTTVHVISHPGCKYYAEHGLGTDEDTEKEARDLRLIGDTVVVIAHRDITVKRWRSRFTNRGATIRIDLMEP
ncbi:hypothetical protein KW786_02985 [Candidatus Parcubacteria bacterium]|nr:hypothetical protein [Candidatus Parcubacteria bacterium]